MQAITRRSFLASSVAASAVFGSASFSRAQDYAGSQASSPPAPSTPEPQRPAALDATLVRTFVAAGHNNIAKLKELLAVEPRLIDGSVDLGGGDWETALGAAAHVGNRTNARFLIEQGARPDAFCAAMLGEADFIRSLMRFSPQAANARGPHGYTMMYHLGYSGNIALGETVRPHVRQAKDFNQALFSATATGRREFVAWLLESGADNVNVKSFGKTPLDLALEGGHSEIVELLRAKGGIRAGKS